MPAQKQENEVWGILKFVLSPARSSVPKKVVIMEFFLVLVARFFFLQLTIIELSCSHEAYLVMFVAVNGLLVLWEIVSELQLFSIASQKKTWSKTVETMQYCSIPEQNWSKTGGARKTTRRGINRLTKHLVGLEIKLGLHKVFNFWMPKL